MIDPYYSTIPNDHKTTTVLEDAATPYTIRPVTVSIGDAMAPDAIQARETAQRACERATDINAAMAAISAARPRLVLCGPTASVER